MDEHTIRLKEKKYKYRKAFVGDVHVTFILKVFIY